MGTCTTSRSFIYSSLSIAMFLFTPYQTFSQSFGSRMMVTARPNAIINLTSNEKTKLDAGNVIYVDAADEELISFWHLGEKATISREDVIPLEKAKDHFLEQIASPKSAEDQLLLGIAHARSERHEIAVEHFTLALELEPNNLRALRYRAQSNSALRKHDASKKDLDQALKLAPGDYLTFNFIGNNFFTQEKFESAKKNYLKSLELEPNFYIPLTNLAAIAFEQGELELYSKCLTRAMKLNPADLDAEYFLAYQDFANEEFKLAKKKFAAILEKNPDFVPVLAYQARILYREGKYSECLEALNRAEKVDDADDQTMSALALYLSACPDESIRDGQRALNLAEQIVADSRGKYGYGLCLLASAQCEMGDYEDAIKTLDKCEKATFRSRYLEREIRSAALEERPFRLPDMPQKDKDAGMIF